MKKFFATIVVSMMLFSMLASCYADSDQHGRDIVSFLMNYYNRFMTICDANKITTAINNPVVSHYLSFPERNGFDKQSGLNKIVLVYGNDVMYKDEKWRVTVFYDNQNIVKSVEVYDSSSNLYETVSFACVALALMKEQISYRDSSAIMSIEVEKMMFATEKRPYQFDDYDVYYNQRLKTFYFVLR